jgi:F0F1-type ATP synthase assembly protein I
MGKVKQGQYSSFDDSLRGKSLHDLFREIRRDTSLSMFEQQRTINQVEGVTRGATPGTPISSLMSRGLGGTVGYLIAKYFEMSPVGKIVSTAAGYGLGKVVHDQFNRPPQTDPPGWRIM